MVRRKSWSVDNARRGLAPLAPAAALVQLRWCRGCLSHYVTWSTLIASASLVNAWTNVSLLNHRPSNNASEAEPIDHISFATDAAGAVRGWRQTNRG
jgi:hypothetical protein